MSCKLLSPRDLHSLRILSRNQLFRFCVHRLQHGLAIAWNTWAFTWRRRRACSWREHQRTCCIHSCAGRCSAEHRRLLCGHHNLFQTGLASGRSRLHIHFLAHRTLHNDYNYERCPIGECNDFLHNFSPPIRRSHHLR